MKYNEKDLRKDIDEALSKLEPNVKDRNDRLDVALRILDEYPRISGIFNSYELYDGEFNQQVDEFYEKLKRYEKDGTMPS